MKRINKNNKQFIESAVQNNNSYIQYFNRLTELATTVFEWENLPDTVDSRFLELALFTDGYCVFFKDDVIGYLCLRCTLGGQMSVYDIPTERIAYAPNGYNNILNQSNSVVIFNNFLHTNNILEVETYAKKLYELDRTIDVNINAQKTPILIQASETQRLSLKNLYMKYEGNEPYIFADNTLNKDCLQVLRTDAPYVADKLFDLKTNVWNEYLTYIGIPNIQINKKERLITDEVTRLQGGVTASRNSRLLARLQAVEQINNMFGLNIKCKVKDEYNTEIDTQVPEEKVTMNYE